MACVEQTEILGIIYRGKSCFYLSKGLKENVTETFERQQTFVYAVTTTQTAATVGHGNGSVCAEWSPKIKKRREKNLSLN